VRQLTAIRDVGLRFHEITELDLMQIEPGE